MNLTIQNWEEYTFYLTLYLKERNSEQFHYDFSQLPLHYQLRFFKELTYERRLLFYKFVSPDDFAPLFSKLGAQHQSLILNELPDTYRDGLLNAMRTDAFVAMVETFDLAERERLLHAVPAEKERKLTQILSFEEDSVGAYMTTEYVAVPDTFTVEETFEHVRAVAKHAESIYYIYVTQDDYLLGVVSLRELFIARDERANICDIMKKQLIALHPHVHYALAIDAIFEHDLIMLPVVSMDNELLGIVTVDDIVDLHTNDDSVEERPKKKWNERLPFARAFTHLLHLIH
ncbi:CBS domain-containing protein [Planococcaceae bacterium Storch 2/2-2]|nr:CBS domain-containing protein [Planococcaceae bacterium Storch 2/2-2]